MGRDLEQLMSDQLDNVWDIYSAFYKTLRQDIWFIFFLYFLELALIIINTIAV